jgi:hypothetical protein
MRPIQPIELLRLDASMNGLFQCGIKTILRGSPANIPSTFSA